MGILGPRASRLLAIVAATVTGTACCALLGLTPTATAGPVAWPAAGQRRRPRLAAELRDTKHGVRRAPDAGGGRRRADGGCAG